MRRGIDLICVWICFLGILHAQEKEAEPIEKKQLWGEITLGYLQPLAYGDHMTAKAHSLTGGAYLEQLIRPNSHARWFVGWGAQAHWGEVTDPSRVGAYDNSVFLRVYALGGYTAPLGKTLHLDLYPALGYVRYIHEKEEARDFNDNGVALAAHVKLNYPWSRYFGLSLDLSHQWDFLGTAVPQTDKGFFNSQTLFYVGIGLSIRLWENPKSH